MFFSMRASTICFLPIDTAPITGGKKKGTGLDTRPRTTWSTGPGMTARQASMFQKKVGIRKWWLIPMSLNWTMKYTCSISAMKSANTVLGWPGWKVILLRPDSGAWIMLWKKLGRIFDPTQHTLANHCVEFAQSPQALVFDDFLRIYFSTREKDPSGKYLSHISYVDIDKNLQKITRIADHTVIGLGGLGCFDEHGIFPMNVLRNKGRIFAYTCGWSRRVSVSVETSIGFALSEDHGSTFQKMGTGPILTASPDEPFLVGDPFVQIYDDVFHMWYIYGTRWFHPPEAHSAERIYKIGHATS